jgi:hypothetical protein
MFFSTLVTPSSGRSGKLLAATMVVGGLLLALIAMKFRVFSPLPDDPTTQATQPAGPSMQNN